MATRPPRRGRSDKQNEEVINMHDIRNVLIRLAALITARAPASRRPQNWRLCLNTLCAPWWIYPLELGCFLFIHAPLQYICLFISQQECIQKRALGQLGTNHKLQWNSWLWAALAVTRGEVIYAYAMPGGLRKTRMKYELGHGSLPWEPMDGQLRRERWLQIHDACNFSDGSRMSGWDQLLLTDSEKQGEGDRKAMRAPGGLGAFRGKESHPRGMRPFRVITEGIKPNLKKWKKSRHACI